MNIIKLNAISSTNEYLKKLIAVKTVPNYTTITAQFQTNGKGQMGKSWFSEKGKNLICSILVNIHDFNTRNQFYLNMAVSLATVSAIESKTMRSFLIKWPNDILSAHKKVAGILIENILFEDKIKHSIVGIGINLNQTEFVGIPDASSLKNITKKSFSQELILNEILKQLPYYINYVSRKDFISLKNMYLLKLYRFERPAMFTNFNTTFLGKIIDINSEGELVVQTEKSGTKSFGLKEIAFAK